MILACIHYKSVTTLKITIFINPDFALYYNFIDKGMCELNIGLAQEWIQMLLSVQFSSVQSLSRVRLFATPWIAARQASLSITSSQSSLKLLSIESVMPSSHLILCHPLLLLPPIPPSVRVFSNESTLCTRCPKYWSFSFSISPSNEQIPVHTMFTVGVDALWSDVRTPISLCMFMSICYSSAHQLWCVHVL